MSLSFEVLERLGLPTNVVKCANDCWTFVLETKSGRQIAFGSADVHGNVLDSDSIWLDLLPNEDIDPDFLRFVDGPVDVERCYILKERPLSIRLSEISWIADGYS